MDLADKRKPDDRLFVDPAEHIPVHPFLDFFHRHVQKKPAFSRSNENELVFRFEDRHVLHTNHHELRTASNKNSLEPALTPSLIKLRPLSLRWSSVETRNTFRQPLAIDRL